MRIPSVITSGELLSRIRYHWDELIAYLRATRLVAGNGISISEHPTGTIISVNPQPTGGAGSAGSSGYNGFFKIQRTAQGVAVVNGSNPDGTICGYTDLIGALEVSRAEITGTSGTVTLYVHYNSATGYYSTSFTNSSGAVLSQIIGTYTATSITQIWRDDTIRFSRFYFV